MTQTTGPSATRAAGKTPAKDATGGTANTASAAPSGTSGSALAGALGEWGNRLRVGVSQLLAPRPAAGAQSTTAGRGQGASGAAGATPQRPRTGKVMLGMLAFVAGAELLLFLVQFLDSRFFKGYLETHTVAPPNTPLLGGVTWFLFILLVLTLGLWMALNRLGIIQPLTARPQPQTTAARGKTPATTTTVGRNRAARLRAAEAPGNTTTKAASAKGASTASARRVDASTHDAAYYRVKAAQRSRKRRDAKR
jgi:hypothetical protein